MNDQFKEAVTVAEMARMVGLSRSRFYQLIGTSMPEPSRDAAGRPFFSEEQQRVVLEVRRRHCGVDGKPVLFYASRGKPVVPLAKRTPKPTIIEDRHADILAGVRALGLTTTTVVQVRAAIQELFPGGLTGVDPGTAIRAIFLSLKSQNSSDNQG